MLLQAATRTAAPSWLHRLARTAPTCAYSTQYEESVHRPNPSRSQAVESPPITPDSSTCSADHVSDGRSSQTTSAYVAEEPRRQLVHKVCGCHGRELPSVLRSLGLSAGCLILLKSCLGASAAQPAADHTLRAGASHHGPLVLLQVLAVYEARSLEDQRRVLTELYDPNAIYENNITQLRGRDEIIRRFALLPVTTHSVRLEYEKPVVLGATTSA